MKRKQFLQRSGAALLGTMLFRNSALASLTNMPINKAMGLQLFTFFNEIDNDVQGTLKKIAAIGYKEIESAFSKKGGLLWNEAKRICGVFKGYWPELEIASCAWRPF